jgi:hypothetical protein
MCHLLVGTPLLDRTTMKQQNQSLLPTPTSLQCGIEIFCPAWQI